MMLRPVYITQTPKAFRVSFDYNPKLVAQLKRIPSAPRWDPSEKEWVVMKDDLRYPPGRNAQWYVDAFADWAVRIRLASAKRYKEIETDIDYTLPELLPFTGEHYMLLDPYPYQLEGVRYALDHKRCIFGDEPGLGKTLTAICSVVKAHREAKVYGESFPVLVVCPASLKINWQREFRKFAGMNSIILDDSNRSTWEQFYNLKLRNGDRMCNVFITNYESLRKFFVQKMAEGRLTQKGITYDPRVALFNTVIIDESHKCKSPKTQQSKFVEGICKGKRFVFELTGTPVVNNNTDLIQQLKILGRLNDFGGYNRFMSRFCDGPSLSSRLRELNYRLWSTCFFRREKQKVLSQLPEKSRQYITCDITNRKEYNDAERDVIRYLREYKNADDDKVQRAMRGAIMVKMGILKSIAAKGKIKVVSEFVHDIIDGEHGEKLILFAYLKEVVTALKKEFP